MSEYEMINLEKIMKWNLKWICLHLRKALFKKYWLSFYSVNLFNLFNKNSYLLEIVSQSATYPETPP